MKQAIATQLGVDMKDVKLKLNNDGTVAVTITGQSDVKVSKLSKTITGNKYILDTTC